jgi:hypothetical protein
MFDYCKIRLTQKGNSLTVTLLHSDLASPWQMMAGINYTGKWRLGDNSITGDTNPNYTIGTATPQQYKFWNFSIIQKRLTFFEDWVSMDGDGGAKHTQKETLILDNARFANGKITPWDDTYGTGPAIVLLPSNVLRDGGLEVRWEYVPNY